MVLFLFLLISQPPGSRAGITVPVPYTRRLILTKGHVDFIEEMVQWNLDLTTHSPWVLSPNHTTSQSLFWPYTLTSVDRI